MNEQKYRDLFESMKPGFFAEEGIRSIADDLCFEEMILPLTGDQDLSEPLPGACGSTVLPLPPNVTFGYYEGDFDELMTQVARVVPAWPNCFAPSDRVYCSAIDGKLASFCIVEDMGSHHFDGKQCKIGGPGCVGTLPEYRRMGIGLAMVRDVTEILRSEGYDYSYIHYTGVSHWYQKLGYQTILRWNNKGYMIN